MLILLYTLYLFLNEFCIYRSYLYKSSGVFCPKSGSQNDRYWISWERLTQVLCSLIRECKLFGLLWDFTTWMCTWTEFIHATCSELAKPRFLVKLCIFELRHRSVPSNMLLHFQNTFWKRQAVSNPGGVWWPFEYRLKCQSKNTQHDVLREIIPFYLNMTIKNIYKLCSYCQS